MSDEPTGVLGVLTGLGSVLANRGPAEVLAEGFRRKLEWQDLLWAARSVVGEDPGHPAEVMWCMLQRWVAREQRQPGREPHWRDLIRAFSQPVNPAWLDPEGVRCRAHPEACTPRHLTRRREVSSLGWSAIGRRYPMVARATLLLGAGELENPIPGMTNFAALPSAARKPGAVCIGGGNWFIPDDPPVRGMVRLV